ncbi:MAG: hypothetical protein JJLCMIEE_03133 [Acidimicrobiales bacterium]|nr:hypothetical protein [Acidimicrobiales bacterium]
MAPSLDDIATELVAEQQRLDDLVSPLGEGEWSRPCIVGPWTIRAQVAHLADSERLATLAATDEAAFAEALAQAIANSERLEAGDPPDLTGLEPAALLAQWRLRRRATVNAVLERGQQSRIPWVTGSLSSRSFLTARLMETWAHSQDVHDALGATHAESNALLHVAHLGVATRAFSFGNRGLEPPADDLRVELVAPDGTIWAWGPPGAGGSVEGPAVDFCLVVTRRRHVDDTGLSATGGARRWLDIAQAFAGPPVDPARWP